MGAVAFPKAIASEDAVADEAAHCASCCCRNVVDATKSEPFVAVPTGTAIVSVRAATTPVTLLGAGAAETWRRCVIDAARRRTSSLLLVPASAQTLGASGLFSGSASATVVRRSVAMSYTL